MLKKNMRLFKLKNGFTVRLIQRHKHDRRSNIDLQAAQQEKRKWYE